ncbi:metal-dependent hydrolase [Aquisalimonas asiatica]|uniref:metal-dependent hydrolase n=1 Tax=Aquisalimonas asiatica TaxID=406100 RepID=UPI001113E51D|nr:metal-dependent hydrolase [Aquisalimonas asiatica]
MDTLTHALSGALAGRATAPRQPRPDQLSLRERTWIGFLAAAAPDIDIVFTLFGHVTYLENHRGITHSLLLMPLWAWLLAALCAVALGRRYTWRAYYGVILLGIFIHILGDLITSYGTQILAPFSNWAPGFNTTFIIDPWFSGVLLAGLVASLYWRPRVGAALGLAAVTALVLFQYTQYRTAVGVADGWARAQGYSQYTAEAYPQPWSAFNWKLVVDHGDVYDMARVNLRRDTVPADPGDDAGLLRRLWAAYPPVEDAVWERFARFGDETVEPLAREVWAQDEMAFFHWFASYPALRQVDQRNGDQCVVFEDLRFRLEGMDSPFRYGMCRGSADDGWALYRMLDNGERHPLD